MLHHATPDLTTVVASCRPRQLDACLRQYRAQRPGFTTELVVVAEGDDTLAAVARRHDADRIILKPVEGNSGAAAKDVGIRLARGRYVNFWDDDNLYAPYALAAALTAAWGVDLGVTQCDHSQQGRTLPAELPRDFRLGEIDTMCLCVRRELALAASWHDHRGPGTDWYWLAKLLQRRPTWRFVPIVVGRHL